MNDLLLQSYYVALPIILTALMGYIVWLLKKQKRDRDANSKGTMLLLRVQLIEYHDKYMRIGEIPSYAYENFNEMYDAYHKLVIVGICLCVGYVIKKWVKDVDNKYIPTVCALLGVILSIWISGWNVSPAVILSGLFSGLASTGLHQLFKQYIEKKEGNE